MQEYYLNIVFREILLTPLLVTSNYGDGPDKLISHIYNADMEDPFPLCVALCLRSEDHKFGDGLIRLFSIFFN